VWLHKQDSHRGNEPITCSFRQNYAVLDDNRYNELSNSLVEGPKPSTRPSLYISRSTANFCKLYLSSPSPSMFTKCRFFKEFSLSKFCMNCFPPLVVSYVRSPWQPSVLWYRNNFEWPVRVSIYVSSCAISILNCLATSSFLYLNLSWAHLPAIHRK
jgi:hypothetical protein